MSHGADWGAGAEWPKVTRALLIGGEGDGWVIPVRGGPGSTMVIGVTLVAGFAQEMFDLGPDHPLWERANRSWRFYTRIENLPPDGFGRVGYWFTSREGQQAGDVPDLAMQHFLDMVHQRLAVAEEGQHWPIVEATLNDLGHGLVLDGPEVDVRTGRVRK
jgi:hypothetical protein